MAEMPKNSTTFSGLPLYKLIFFKKTSAESFVAR
jgi:hypothetical protein